MFLGSSLDCKSGEAERVTTGKGVPLLMKEEFKSFIFGRKEIRPRLILVKLRVGGEK